MRIWQAGEYTIEYKESTVSESLLWESHCHSSFECIAVLEGDITVSIEGRPYRVQSGECAILSPLLYHTVASNKQGKYARLAVQFDISSVPPPLRERFLSEREICLLPFPSARVLRDGALCEDPSFYAPLAESIMVALLYEAYEKKGLPPEEKPDEILSAIVSFIDRHIKEPIALSDIAASACLSVSSVCHIFKQKMKISPMRYLQKKRLALAKKYISEGVLPMAAALLSGYEDYSSFFRAYKKCYQSAPSDSKTK